MKRPWFFKQSQFLVKNLAFAGVLAVLVGLFTPHFAHAQIFSGSNFNSGRETQNVASCRGEALTLNQRLITVRQLINTIINCNENGQVYNEATDSCVTPQLSPDHEFTSLSAGSTFALENPDGTMGTAVVVGGGPGADAACTTIEDPLASCTAPWGATVAHGGSVLAYQRASVPHGSSCNSQTRTCNDGVLSGSYTNQSCTESGPGGCTAPWGATVAHGDSVTAYETASVAHDESCNSETRSCNNGTLSGNFTNQSCSVGTPADCSAPWGAPVAHGNNITAFQSATVPYGESCASQSRTCNDGTLSGSYTHQACLPEGPARCPLPWGGTIADGRTVTAYRDASVPSTGSCERETRSCRNGVLSGNFTNQNCTVRKPVTTCHPWQWDFDGWCRGRPQCNNFNLLDRACHGDPSCTLRNVKYNVNTCAVCNVEGERCVTR